MHLPSFCACLVAFPLFARGKSLFPRDTPTAQSGIADTSLPDPVSFVDDFVDSWVKEHPELTSPELDRLLAAAKAAKAAVLDPAPSKRAEAPPVTRHGERHAARHVRFLRHRRSDNSTVVGNSTLADARAIVRQAQEEANRRNQERFQNPRVNSYYANLSPEAALKARAATIATFTVNETVAAAAAVLAEADGAHDQPKPFPPLPAEFAQIRSEVLGQDAPENGPLAKRATARFWMEDIQHAGKVPFGGPDNKGYKVFRNVKDYGAVGDGKTDDTAAINKAMKDQGRCGENCGASTVKPAIVYFPSGTYLVSSPIIAYYNTQMVGNANQFPTIRAAKSFVGLGVISSDVYTGANGGAEEWYINQNNFLRQLRNFNIDVRDADMTDIAGIHWQVAQATSIQNVWLYMSDSAAKNHIGIFAENGSGGFMSEVYFFNGAIGIQCGNQQFTTRNMIFASCRTGIDLLWDWGWTWQGIAMSTTEYGIRMRGSYRGGSLLLLDSYMGGMPTGIYIATPKGSTPSEQFSITIDNLRIANVGTTVKHETASVTLAGGSTTIQSWMLGKVYDQTTPTGRYQSGPLPSLHPKTPELSAGNGYFVRVKPQYQDLDANTFFTAAGLTAGDGVSDDSFVLSLLAALTTRVNRPLYIPFGSYIVTETVKIPVGARIVGECWAQIVAKGAYFSDANNPRPMVQVGEYGETGVVEIQDLLFTTQGPTAGVILMEWNVAQSTQGSAAMWDSHFRIGGAKGSGLTAADCPKRTGEVNQNCIAGSMLLHMTSSSSGYLENVWAWVADHDFDSGPAQTQIDVYVARGILIESQGVPVWMYGTASEHCMLYQYLLFGAKNVFMGMIQTESPYFLPKPQAPAPFTDYLGYFPSDPTFKDCPASNPHCAAAWGLMIIGSTNVHIFGAGLYNWFQDYTQPCVDTQDCQQRVVYVEESGNVWMYNLYTIGTAEMVNLHNTTPIMAKANTNTNEHPFTSIINAWLVVSTGEGRVPVDNEGHYEGDLDEFPEIITDLNRAPCNAKFKTLGEMQNAADKIPGHCFDTYLVDVELLTLKGTFDAYDESIRNGYDDKFKVYERVVRRQAPESVDAYMRGAQKSGAFRCAEDRYVQCCSDCSSGYGCSAGCDLSKPCKSGEHRSDIGCPTRITDPTDFFQTPKPGKITYTLLDQDKFFREIGDEFGIQRDWIEFGDRMAYSGNGCQYAGNDVQECIRKSATWWHGYPLLKNITVPNPRDIVSKSYDRSRALAESAAQAQRFAAYDLGVTGRSDLVDALSLPALMLAEAIETMKHVVEVADKVLEEERKADIANFITAIFMLIPVAGEVAAAVGGAAMRAIIGMAGELANVGMTIYELVNDPSSALSTVMGFVMGGGVSRRPFREAAAARRGMSSTEKGKLAPRVKTDLDTITNLRTACLKK